MLTNKVTDLLNIKYPIIQAPMAGGVTTSELVAAVSNHGALGMIGAGYLTADQMREQIREIKKVTSKSFGVNLFVPTKFTVSVRCYKIIERNFTIDSRRIEFATKRSGSSTFIHRSYGII